MIHPRFHRVARARNELSDFVCEWALRHELTGAEVVCSLASIIAYFTKFLLRSERHPDDDSKKADEA